MLRPKQTLKQIMNEGILEKKQEVIIPEGTYYCAKSIFFTDIHQVLFNGFGVQIIMTDPGENGFVFHNSSNITLKGFSIDYNPLPFTQATVISRNSDATEFEFEIHKGYPDFEVTSCSRAEVFDPKTLLWKMTSGLGASGDVYPIEKHAVSPRRGYMKLATATPSIVPGDYLAFVSRKRDFLASALEFKHCSTVKLEDLTILSSPGMAVFCADMDGENYFRYTIARGPQNRYGVARLISTNADGLHYHAARRGPIVEQCDFSFMSDDSININGPGFVVKKIETPNDLWIEANEYNAICFSSIARGDTIRFMSPENYDILAEARIESVGEIHKIAEVTDAKIRKTSPGDYAGGLFKKGAIIRISCDRPLKLSGNEYCNVFSLNSPGFKICDSYFHDHRAIGLRIFGTDGIIANNRIERIKRAAINIGPAWYGDHDGWGKNIQIKKNKIDSCALFRNSSGAITVSAAKISNVPSEYRYPRCNRNMTIVENKIMNSGSSGIFVNAADGVQVQGNHIYASNQIDCNQSTDIKAEYAIDVQNSSNVKITDNKIKSSGEFCSGDIRPIEKN